MTKEEKQAVCENMHAQAYKCNAAYDRGGNRFREAADMMLAVIRFLAHMDIYTHVFFSPDGLRYIDKVSVLFPGEEMPRVVYDRQEEGQGVKNPPA